MTEQTPDQVHDVVIIGSGPAGYTAAVYTARANLSPIVLAGSVTAGGELMNTTEVENFPGFPEGVMGPDLMMNMEAQARRFGADIRHEDATAVKLDQPIKEITLGSGAVLHSRAVILATGSAYRELGVPGEKALSGHGVSWCATCDGFFFREQEIAVVGGGDSAMEEALFLTKFASKVYVIHRREELRASQIMADRAKANEKIEFIWNSEVTEVHGEGKVNQLALRNTVTGAASTLDVTGLFVAIGHDPRVDLFKDQLQLTEDGTVWVDGRSSKTSLPGVFAAGDVLDPTYRQAITAAGSGCAAAIDVEHWLGAMASSDALEDQMAVQAA
ncbi:thioredoxin-disulfide reductase [Nesterenkonia massiliensis]|uniref:Thioredoxin reductase n=1 Tax=Nesterenkonia massiliensis TaxID=1232429 RepID=A0ABT2HRR8_9MICC|nr:thioredoxin-disulfide reductase [Nesterenkonia massiliensis]MCT1607219.1 thioredoxin-disulfide reductase [Nesterenkonia massiliensis]